MLRKLLESLKFQNHHQQKSIKNHLKSSTVTDDRDTEQNKQIMMMINALLTGEQMKGFVRLWKCM